MGQPLCYLDNNATTQVAPEVLEAMLPFLRERWGNPSSAYLFGHQLMADLDRARGQVAALLNADASEIIFTSCATESINTVFHNALLTQPGRRHVITTAVEHSATMKCCAQLEQRGVRVTYLPVDSGGALDLARLDEALTDETALASIMLANNETGVMFPVAEAARRCRERQVLFHTDAVQAPGKAPLDVRSWGVDFLSLSAHKLHAPKGIGALFARRGVKFQPYLAGGGQERGRRAGTENVAGMVAFGRAAELAREELARDIPRLRALRDRLEAGILERIPGTVRNGALEPRLPNTANLAFSGVEAEGMLLLLDQAGICVSSGSACTTGSLDPSHVLIAMGCAAARARGSLRFSFGRYNREADVDRVLEKLPGMVERLRELAPVD